MKKLILTTGLLMMLGLGGISAYAAGPGEQPVQPAQTIVSYTQAQVATLGAWEADSLDPSIYRFKDAQGVYLTNAWIESLTTPGTWYFLDSNGVMLRSTTTPDGYPVDQTGAYTSPAGSSTSGITADISEQNTSDTQQSNLPSNTNNSTNQDRSQGHNKKDGPRVIRDTTIDYNANKGLDLHG